MYYCNRIYTAWVLHSKDEIFNVEISRWEIFFKIVVCSAGLAAFPIRNASWVMDLNLRQEARWRRPPREFTDKPLKVFTRAYSNVLWFELSSSHRTRCRSCWVGFLTFRQSVESCLVQTWELQSAQIIRLMDVKASAWFLSFFKPRQQRLWHLL